MGSRLTVNTHNLTLDLSSKGYPITNTESATPVFNDINACVQWCHNMMTKGNQHIEHRENVTREWVEAGSISVSHVSRKCNPADIFTKDMRDAANFCHIHEAFMSRGSDFLKGIYACLSELVVTPPLHVAHTAHYVQPDWPGILEVILSHSAFRTSVAILCLSNAGQEPRKLNEKTQNKQHHEITLKSILCYAQSKPDSVLFVFVQHVFSKVRLMCGSCPLLAWEFRPAAMGRVLIVLTKSWKKIEIMKIDWNPEILRTYVGTYTQIMKQDWNPETRLKSWNKISSGKTKTLTFV